MDIALCLLQLALLVGLSGGREIVSSSEQPPTPTAAKIVWARGPPTQRVDNIPPSVSSPHKDKSFFRHLDNNPSDADSYEFEYHQTNENQSTSRREEVKGGAFKVKVVWQDKGGNSGEHQWEYQHVDKETGVRVKGKFPPSEDLEYAPTGHSLASVQPTGDVLKTSPSFGQHYSNPAPTRYIKQSGNFGGTFPNSNAGGTEPDYGFAQENIYKTPVVSKTNEHSGKYSKGPSEVTSDFGLPLRQNVHHANNGNSVVSVKSNAGEYHHNPLDESRGRYPGAVQPGHDVNFVVSLLKRPSDLEGKLDNLVSSTFGETYGAPSDPLSRGRNYTHAHAPSTVTFARIPPVYGPPQPQQHFDKQAVLSPNISLKKPPFLNAPPHAADQTPDEREKSKPIVFPGFAGNYGVPHVGVSHGDGSGSQHASGGSQRTSFHPEQNGGLQSAPNRPHAHSTGGHAPFPSQEAFPRDPANGYIPGELGGHNPNTGSADHSSKGKGVEGLSHGHQGTPGTQHHGPLVHIGNQQHGLEVHDDVPQQHRPLVHTGHQQHGPLVHTGLQQHGPLVHTDSHQQQHGLTVHNDIPQQHGPVVHNGNQQHKPVVHNDIPQQHIRLVHTGHQQHGLAGHNDITQHHGPTGHQQNVPLVHTSNQQHGLSVHNDISQHHGPLVHNNRPHQHGSTVHNDIPQQHGPLINTGHQQHSPVVHNDIPQHHGPEVHNIPQQHNKLVHNNIPQNHGPVVHNNNNNIPQNHGPVVHNNNIPQNHGPVVHNNNIPQNHGAVVHNDIPQHHGPVVHSNNIRQNHGPVVHNNNIPQNHGPVVHNNDPQHHGPTVHNNIPQHHGTSVNTANQQHRHEVHNDIPQHNGPLVHNNSPQHQGPVVHTSHQQHRHGVHNDIPQQNIPLVHNDHQQHRPVVHDNPQEHGSVVHTHPQQHRHGVHNDGSHRIKLQHNIENNHHVGHQDSRGNYLSTNNAQNVLLFGNTQDNSAQNTGVFDKPVSRPSSGTPHQPVDVNLGGNHIGNVNLQQPTRYDNHNGGKHNSGEGLVNGNGGEHFNVHHQNPVGNSLNSYQNSGENHQLKSPVEFGHSNRRPTQQHNAGNVVNSFGNFNNFNKNSVENSLSNHEKNNQIKSLGDYNQQHTQQSNTVNFANSLGNFNAKNKNSEGNFDGNGNHQSVGNVHSENFPSNHRMRFETHINLGSVQKGNSNQNTGGKLTHSQQGGSFNNKHPTSEKNSGKSLPETEEEQDEEEEGYDYPKPNPVRHFGNSFSNSGKDLVGENSDVRFNPKEREKSNVNTHNPHSSSGGDFSSNKAASQNLLNSNKNLQDIITKILNNVNQNPDSAPPSTSGKRSTSASKGGDSRYVEINRTPPTLATHDVGEADNAGDTPIAIAELEDIITRLLEPRPL